MLVKKIYGQIFGAQLSKKEQKALDMEIAKQTAEFNRKNELELDAIFLWAVYQVFDADKNKLKEFYDTVGPLYSELIKHYEMEGSDGAWLCQQKLKDIGVNVEEWSRGV